MSRQYSSSRLGAALTLAAIMGFAGASVARAQGTTILTFDATPGFTDNSPVNQAYGDNVNAATVGAFSYSGTAPFTPGVTTAYSGGTTGPTFFSSGYGNLTNVIRAQSGQLLLVTFTPAAGTSVKLNSFDLASNLASNTTINAVQVFGPGNALLFNQTNVVIPGNSLAPTHLSFFPGVTNSSFLTLQIDATNLQSGTTNIGLDNISITQNSTAPEPSSIALLFTGALSLGGIVARRRRRLS